MLVANCHLHFNDKLDFVKYAQIVYLLEELNKFIPKVTDQKPCVILCGDFNSSPDSSVMRVLHGEEID